MPHSYLLFACMLFFFYGSVQSAAVPTSASKSLSTYHHGSSNNGLGIGMGPCTKGTVTVVSTHISIRTEIHTVTERSAGPTRVGHEKPEVCIKCTPSTRSHVTSTTSTATHTKSIGPSLAITRRFNDRDECKACFTAGVGPEVLSVKTTSNSASKASTKMLSRTDSSTEVTVTPIITSWALIHSIHFDERATPFSTKIADGVPFDRRTATVLPGHAKLEDAPTHGE